MSDWQQRLREALMARSARFLYPPDSPQYREWLRENTIVASQFHHQQYPLTDAWKTADMERWPVGWSPMQYERYANFWCVV